MNTFTEVFEFNVPPVVAEQCMIQSSMDAHYEEMKEGEEVHVSGKKRDDLQETIAFIKSMKNQQPLQYVNFRN